MLKFTSICTCIAFLFNMLGGFFSQVTDFIFFPEAPQTESVMFAGELGAGWNLGNTLDACSKGSSEKAGLESENFWGNPTTTKEMIDYIKEAGFDTVRIPITWAQHLGDAPNYEIDKDWLDRVNEIVDYVLDSGMKAIINVHHDDAFWLVTDYAHEEKATQILTRIWAQVAERFKFYGTDLIFETMNEPRVTGIDEEWSGTDEYREVINNLNFAALKTIRNSGGNNAERFVSITTYAANYSEENIKALKLPDDERVMVSLHFYFNAAHSAEFYDCEEKISLSDKREIYKNFRTMYKYLIKKGYGIVNSEFGWTDRTNIENLSEKTEFYVHTANKFGISCIVWDDGGNFGIIDRDNLTTDYPSYLKAIVN